MILINFCTLGHLSPGQCAQLAAAHKAINSLPPMERVLIISGCMVLLGIVFHLGRSMA